MRYLSTFQSVVADSMPKDEAQSPWPYTLDLLPVSGIIDITQTIWDVYTALQSTLTIVNGILGGPYGMPSTLSQQMENIRFHVINGLALVDTARRTGHNLREPFINIDGLRSTLDLHVAAIHKARSNWRVWLDDAYANKEESERLPPRPKSEAVLFGNDTLTVMQPVALQPAGCPGCFQHYGAATDTTTGALNAVTTPMTLRDYVVIGVVAGGLLLAMSWGK